MAANSEDVDFESFTLPFIEDDAAPEDEDGEPLYEDNAEVLDRMQEAVPDDAISLGRVEYEIDQVRSTWSFEDYYYGVPWPDDDFDWALIRIAWDDNYGRYEWEDCARIKNSPNARDAITTMFYALVKNHWRLEGEQEHIYRTFIDQLEF